MYTPFSNRLLASVLLSLLLSPNVFALKADRTAPMDLTADSWKGTTSGSQSQVWTGNVRISQGSLKIQADKGTVSYLDGEVGAALLEGSPAVISQARDGGGEVRAQARKIDYNLKLSKVILTGGVKIEENGNVTTGERFEYSLESGAITGNGGTGQVTMRLIPKVAKPK